MKALNRKAAHERLQISNPMFRKIGIGLKKRIFAFLILFLSYYLIQINLILYSDKDHPTSQPRGQTPSSKTSEIIDRRLLFYFRVRSGQHHTKFRSISRGPQYHSTRDFNKFFFLFRSIKYLFVTCRKTMTLAS